MFFNSVYAPSYQPAVDIFLSPSNTTYFSHINPHSPSSYICHLWKVVNHSSDGLTLYRIQWLFLRGKLFKCCHVWTPPQGLLEEAGAIPHDIVQEGGWKVHPPTGTVWINMTAESLGQESVTQRLEKIICEGPTTALQNLSDNRSDSLGTT